MGDALSYASCPSDVIHLQNLERTIPSKAALLERQTNLKGMVIRKMKSTPCEKYLRSNDVLVGPLGINPDLMELMELELQEIYGNEVDVVMIKQRAIMKAAVNKWKSKITETSSFDLILW